MWWKFHFGLIQILKKVIATIFGTWHDSWAVVACAKFCHDIIISNWIRAEWNFHRIYIMSQLAYLNVSSTSQLNTCTQVYISEPEAWIRVSGCMYIGLFTNIIDHVLDMRFPDKDRPVVYGTNEIIKMKNYNVKTIIGQQVRCLKCDSCSEILSL